MKKRLTNNLGYKILSVVLAFLLWLIVVNVSDPEKTTTIVNIPINVLNGEAITNQGKVYEIIAGKTASVEVTGPRTIIDSLEPTSFKATADMSKLSLTNAVGVDVELVKASYRSKVKINVQTTVKVKIEDLVTKTFNGEIIDNGKCAEGFVIYNKSMNNSIIEVVAPESVMTTIDRVGVNIDINNANKNFTCEADIQAFDNRGNVINAEKNNIRFNIEKTEVSYVIFPVKQIDIKYEIDQKNYQDIVISSTNISRKNIMIAGSEDNLAKINELELDTSSIVFTPDKTSYQLSYNLNDLLPKGVFVYGEDKTVTIDIETDAIVSKGFGVAVNDIAIKYLKDGYSAAYQSTGTVRFMLKGRKSLLDKFTVDDSSFYVSTKDLLAGEHRLQVMIDLQEGLDLVEPIYVEVKITDMEALTNSTSDVTTPTGTTTNNQQITATDSQELQTTKNSDDMTPKVVGEGN